MDVTKNRHLYIGGSDTPAIMGLNKYKSPLDVYNEKTDPNYKHFEGNEFTHFGTVLEPLMAQEFMRRNDMKVRRVNRLIKHPKHNFILGHIDRKIVGSDQLLEIKTTGFFAGQKWDDGIPDSVFAQVQHYLYILDYHTAFVAVLIGGQEYRQYEVDRSEPFIKYMEKTLLEFWDRVQRKDPPAPRDLAEYSATIMAINEKTKIATTEILSLYKELCDQNDRSKAVKEQMDEIKFKIAEFMGDNERLVDLDGNTLVNFKQNKSGRFNGKKLKEEKPKLYAKYVGEPKGRTFKPNYK